MNKHVTTKVTNSVTPNTLVKGVTIDTSSGVVVGSSSGITIGSSSGITIGSSSGVTIGSSSGVIVGTSSGVAIGTSSGVALPNQFVTISSSGVVLTENTATAASLANEVFELTSKDYKKSVLKVITKRYGSK